MASFSCTGIDEAIKELEQMGQDVHKKTAAAAKAGAQVAQKGMQRRVSVRTGGLKNALITDEPHRSVADGTYCDVYPKGKDERGERYETIGFVNEYGRTNMPAHPFMRTTIEEDADEIAEAMGEELTKEE